MLSKLTLLALPVALLAACQPVPPPSPALPPAPPAAAPAPEPVASTSPIAIRTLSCSDLLGAEDDDRAAASMFFIGYRAALAHVHNLSIALIEAIEKTALTNCAAHPTMTAVQAFAQAVTANRK
jgi:hypothetical protein